MSGSYFYLPKSFNRPPGLQQPTEGGIENNTQHPQLNAKDFLYRIYKQKLGYIEKSGFLPFFCFLDCTDDLFILGTNNFTTAITDSNLLATSDFNLIVNRDASKVSIQKAELHSLTSAKFLDADTVSS